VISDIGMPEVDGYELARRIRATSEFHDIVLVALTGLGQAGDKQRAKDAGFDMHLIKPVSASALEDLIATMPVQPGRADRSHV
jgi:CheY-like chemotaxis protein